MQIKMLPVTAIKPYWRNPRNNENALEAVKKSIADYGFNQPIVVDGQNVIIAGHTRFKVLQEMGQTQIPCVIKDDLTAQQAKAYRIADNKSGEIAVWDMDKLMQELREIKDITEMQEYFPDIDLQKFLEDTGGVDFEPVTQASIDKIEGELSTQFQDRSAEQQDEYIELACPHCAAIFALSKSDVLKQ